jgi:hypothetical protein
MRKCAVKCLTFIAFFIFLSIQSFAQDDCKPIQPNHFNIHSGMDFKDEKPRLDFAARILDLCHNQIVILVAYNSDKKTKATALERLKKSRQYLIRTHKISAQRIMIIYGGTKSEIEMNIYFRNKKNAFLNTKKASF